MPANRLYTSQLKGTTDKTGTVWLVEGKPGNLQTLRAMRALIRRDLGLDGHIQDEGLRRFAAQVVQTYGGGGFNWQTRIRAIWLYVVRQFDYIPDPTGGNENLADARETIRDGWGDCDDLAILIATLLGMVGVSTSLRMARYTPNVNGFEHVYVVAHVPSGDLVLDTAHKGARIGAEVRFKEAFTLPVIEFAEQLRGVMDFALQSGSAIGAAGFQSGAKGAAITGITVGVSAIPVVGQFLAPFVGPIANLFNKTARNKPFSDARDEWKEAIYAQQETIRQAVDSCQLTPQQGVQASQEIYQAYYSACDKNFPKAIAQSCRNFENMPGGFKTREQRINEAGKNCAAKTSNTTQATITGQSQTSETGLAQWVDKKEVGTGVMTALLVGGALYVVHAVTK